MSRHFLYLIGIPGAGKTTLLREAVADMPFVQETKPFAHLNYGNGAQIGAVRDTFSGTDALAMDVQPKVLNWLETCYHTAIVAEGDRLANRAFFTGVLHAGWNLTVMLVDTPPLQADKRRRARGSKQSDVWLKGRVTKVRNLLPYVNERLDGMRPLPDLVQTLRQQTVIRTIRGD